MFATRARPNVQSNTVLRRDGFVLVAVIVVFAFAMTLFGLWAKAAVQAHRQTRSQQFRIQAERLAEAGLQRGLAQHAIDVDYTGETWSIQSGMLHPKRTAMVQVRIFPGDQSETLRLEARAEYPAGALRRAQVTRTIDVSNPPSGDQS